MGSPFRVRSLDCDPHAADVGGGGRYARITRGLNRGPDLGRDCCRRRRNRCRAHREDREQRLPRRAAPRCGHDHRVLHRKLHREGLRVFRRRDHALRLDAVFGAADVHVTDERPRDLGARVGRSGLDDALDAFREVNLRHLRILPALPGLVPTCALRRASGHDLMIPHLYGTQEGGPNI